MTHFQVYLVTGGEYADIPWDATEILTEGDSEWQLSGNLPMGLHGLRGVSLKNRIFMTGKHLN